VTPSSIAATRAQLRRTLRAARAAVPAAHRTFAALSIARHVARARVLARGRRIALYAALRDELDLTPLTRLAEQRGCEIYLPRVVSERAKTMRFVRAGGRMQRNRWGILEPQGHHAVAARFLHVVVLPTLGIDPRGIRLGYGAGFYDKALAYRRVRRAWQGPKLVAAAFEAQRVAHIPAEPHDIRVDMIVTERGLRSVDRRAA
jgi:5-formyltetrahydrofolate cyclo-ligase